MLLLQDEMHLYPGLKTHLRQFFLIYFKLFDGILVGCCLIVEYFLLLFHLQEQFYF